MLVTPIRTPLEAYEDARSQGKSATESRIDALTEFNNQKLSDRWKSAVLHHKSSLLLSLKGKPFDFNFHPPLGEKIPADLQAMLTKSIIDKVKEDVSLPLIEQANDIVAASKNSKDPVAYGNSMINQMARLERAIPDNQRHRRRIINTINQFYDDLINPYSLAWLQATDMKQLDNDMKEMFTITLPSKKDNSSEDDKPSETCPQTCKGAKYFLDQYEYFNELGFLDELVGRPLDEQYDEIESCRNKLNKIEELSEEREEILSALEDSIIQKCMFEVNCKMHELGHIKHRTVEEVFRELGDFYQSKWDTYNDDLKGMLYKKFKALQTDIQDWEAIRYYQLPYDHPERTEKRPAYFHEVVSHKFVTDDPEMTAAEYAQSRGIIIERPPSYTPGADAAFKESSNNIKSEQTQSIKPPISLQTDEVLDPEPESGLKI